MGLFVSKRINKTLISSPAFTAACNSIYADCQSKAQHAFSGLRRYQLLDAAVHLHTTLSTTVPLIHRWVSSPPSQAQVDAALHRLDPHGGWEDLYPNQFRSFALELFQDAVVCGASSTVIKGVPIGAAGIAGVGIASHAGAGFVGRIIGVYAVGVVAAVYLNLS
ncbi:uncharacterized protein LOC120270101 [Dioscorea cayenensis subsp. rotundata]|uniref:Uncharacterized protein LOC120270101 n=1 Tax=Dioscorea cayennensis subsp. rotundata TaxID=55577 RepID=A0AB40C1J2_DIOCR|nr:uncharacterized protein LOC120270101 [Dioscorea cayenensis subsp. rotundata]